MSAEQANAEMRALEMVVARLSDDEVNERLSGMGQEWQEVIRRTSHPTDRRSLLIDIAYVSIP